MQTFIDFTEAMVEDVAQGLSDTIDMIVDILAPDGIGWQQEPMTDAERIDDYVKNYRGNVAAWENKIRTTVSAISQQLQGLPPGVLAQVHPYDIAERLALYYSAQMEGMISEQGVLGKKAQDNESLRPILQQLDDMGIGNGENSTGQFSTPPDAQASGPTP